MVFFLIRANVTPEQLLQHLDKQTHKTNHSAAHQTICPRVLEAPALFSIKTSPRAGGAEAGTVPTPLSLCTERKQPE